MDKFQSFPNWPHKKLIVFRLGSQGPKSAENGSTRGVYIIIPEEFCKTPHFSQQ